ncbi:MAG: PIN domain-containing protein [Gemmatimonadetes bacterium]|nr:PIN domain-containing protein [Gemmatimonadota bacterium]
MLVDTSVWIDAAEGADGNVVERLASLVENGQACLCGPVLLELRQGWSDRDVVALRFRLESLPYLTCPEAVWTRAGDIGSTLRRRGRPVPSLDLIIATLAQWHGTVVLTRDTHFERIAEFTSVLVERI